MLVHVFWNADDLRLQCDSIPPHYGSLWDIYMDHRYHNQLDTTLPNRLDHSQDPAQHLQYRKQEDEQESLGGRLPSIISLSTRTPCRISTTPHPSMLPLASFPGSCERAWELWSRFLISRDWAWSLDRSLPKLLIYRFKSQIDSHTILESLIHWLLQFRGHLDLLIGSRS